MFSSSNIFVKSIYGVLKHKWVNLYSILKHSNPWHEQKTENTLFVQTLGTVCSHTLNPVLLPPMVRTLPRKSSDVFITNKEHILKKKWKQIDHGIKKRIQYIWNHVKYKRVQNKIIILCAPKPRQWFGSTLFTQKILLKSNPYHKISFPYNVPEWTFTQKKDKLKQKIIKYLRKQLNLFCSHTDHKFPKFSDLNRPQQDTVRSNTLRRLPQDTVRSNTLRGLGTHKNVEKIWEITWSECPLLFKGPQNIKQISTNFKDQLKDLNISKYLIQKKRKQWKNILNQLHKDGFCKKNGKSIPNTKYMHKNQDEINKIMNVKINKWKKYFEYIKFFDKNMCEKTNQIIDVDKPNSIIHTTLKKIEYIIKSSIAKLYAAKYKLKTRAQVYKKAGKNFTKKLDM